MSLGLLAVHCNHASILHRYGDMGPQRYWDHDLDLLGLRDVIDHVTIGLGVGTFLLVGYDDYVCILYRYGDTGLQIFRGHEFDLFCPRDVINHVTIGLAVSTFLLVVMMTMHLSCTDSEIRGFKNFGVTSLTSSVT